MELLLCRNFLAFAMLFYQFGVLILATIKAGAGYPTGITSEGNGTPIAFSEFLRVLRKNPTQYSFEMGSLVDGDEFYRLEGDLSADCRATIMAYTGMVLNWTSYPDIFFDLRLNSLQESEQSEHPFESVCELVEGQINKTSKVGDFVQLRETLKAKTTTKPKYYFDMLLETGEDVEAASNKIFHIPGVAKMLANEEFRKQRYSQTAYTKEAHIFAKSVEIIANKGKYKAWIQQIFDQILEETAKVIGQITSMRDMVLKGYKTYTFTPSMMQLLQKRLEGNADLKSELESAKKLVQATL